MTFDLVFSETPQAAKAAAKLVKVTYKDVKPPILTIQDAIKENSFHPEINVNHDIGDTAGIIIINKAYIAYMALLQNYPTQHEKI